MKRICIFYFPVHLIIQHENCFVLKAFWNKIAFAGHGARCLLRLTFHLYDLAFSVFVFAKREHTLNADDNLPINCLRSAHPRVCSAGFFFLIPSPFDSNLTMNPSWVKSVFSKQPKEATLWRELRKFCPQWSGGGQKSVMRMSSDICNFCSCETGCPKFSDIR